jgi:hypothetical protein
MCTPVQQRLVPATHGNLPNYVEPKLFSWVKTGTVWDFLHPFVLCMITYWAPLEMALISLNIISPYKRGGILCLHLKSEKDLTPIVPKYELLPILKHVHCALCNWTRNKAEKVTWKPLWLWKTCWTRRIMPSTPTDEGARLISFSFNSHQRHLKPHLCHDLYADWSPWTASQKFGTHTSASCLGVPYP